MASNTFLKKEILASSWGLYKKNAGILILLFVVGLIISLASYANQTIGWGVPSALFTLLSMSITMINIVIMLDIVRGTYTNFKTALTTSVANISAKQFLVYIITSIVYGITFGLMFMLYGYVVLDENQGVFKSLGRSKEITKGHRWNMFLMGLIMFLLMLVSMIPVGLGLFITVPLGGIVMTSMYAFLKKNYATTPVVEAAPVQ